MLERLLPVAVMVACSGVFAGWGCSRRPARVPPPQIDRQTVAQQAIDQYDRNGDGSIGGDELERAPALKAALGTFDADGDGGISALEIAARIEAWQQAKVGLLSVICQVSYQDAPLSGAAVTFVPEPFLGGQMQPASGVTDASGTAEINVSGFDAPGVACGLYRVKISKIVDAAETIPARYNTQTTLGVEVTQDLQSASEILRFELE